MKHTPGPWEVRGHEIIATTIRPDWADIDSGERLSIIDLRGAMGGNPVEDANLIAAAPELLEALEEALEVVGSWGEGGDPEWLIRAKQAIKKSKG